MYLSFPLWKEGRKELDENQDGFIVIAPSDCVKTRTVFIVFNNKQSLWLKTLRTVEASHINMAHYVSRFEQRWR